MESAEQRWKLVSEKVSSYMMSSAAGKDREVQIEKERTKFAGKKIEVRLLSVAAGRM